MAAAAAAAAEDKKIVEFYKRTKGRCVGVLFMSAKKKKTMTEWFRLFVGFYPDNSSSISYSSSSSSRSSSSSSSSETPLRELGFFGYIVSYKPTTRQKKFDSGLPMTYHELVGVLAGASRIASKRSFMAVDENSSTIRIEFFLKS